MTCKIMHEFLNNSVFLEQRGPIYDLTVRYICIYIYIHSCVCLKNITFAHHAQTLQQDINLILRNEAHETNAKSTIQQFT